ncbi:MAG: serine--tRNA ligase [Trueperaceae bacterium]|nr:serine--tRNA ligase [Trueperaceae bacterium]
MLDPSLLRDHPEAVRAGVRAKRIEGAEEALDALSLADEEHRLLRRDLEEKQARRNRDSKRIGELKRDGADADELIRTMGELSAEVKQLEERERSLRERIERLTLEVPNLPHESVPIGESEHDNVVLYERGDPRPASASLQPHWSLMRERGWLDMEAGARIASAGFPVFRGEGARLVRALERYFIDRLADAGFAEVRVPLLANRESATATGQLPDKEGQMYRVQDDLYLVPTSEVSVTNLHRGEILDAAELPLRYCAFTPCFRREAGSHGREVRGLNRVHQFDKVEMVAFTAPEDSYEMLESMTELAEALLTELGLAYRRLLMCTADMGFTQAKKYDLEVWSPAQSRWLEVSSVSNVTDFQARRLATRARPGGVHGSGRTTHVHTLNGSALAFPRTIAALVETHQDDAGEVAVPAVLAPYLGTDRLR